MDYRVLGPLEVRDSEGPIALGGTKQRALLALLLLSANRVVSRERLIDELWGDQPPATAVTTVQVYVSRLRKLLPAETLQTRPPGYILEVHPEEVDLLRFERLFADARNGDPERASRLLARALGLWRGLPLAEFVEPFARVEGARLEDLRLATLEERIEADLELGRHAELVGELDSLIAEHPHRERLRGQLMLALYRSGRQAEALETYQTARRTLVEELGIEPDATLQRLHRSILEHDPALAPRPAPPKGNLPADVSTFVGRDAELVRISELMGGRARLVTMTGAGGAGKTRLALQAARALEPAFRDGIYFVDLAPLADPALIISTLAQALGVPDTAGSLVETVISRLKTMRTLLLFDNFEHLTAGASDVARLLAACPELRTFVTSRVPLRLRGEHELEVGALDEPAAVQLFVDRARQVQSGFAAADADSVVAEICRRLDRLPLAIELAAARAKLFSPPALLARLEQRFELLTDGARDLPARQQTLRATIDWSYGLLGHDEQTLFALLAVFAGGCTLEAAEAVCGPDRLLAGLSTLVDINLLRRTEQTDRALRFTMLETIRAYALELVERSGEVETVRRRHAEHFRALAARIADDAWEGRDVDWLAVESDHDNFREALRWFETRGDREALVRLTSSLCVFWSVRGHLAEASTHVATARRLVDDLPRDARAGLWHQAGWTAVLRGDLDQAHELLEEALAVWRDLGNKREETSALSALAVAASERGRNEEAQARMAEAAAIARKHGYDGALADLVHHQALIAMAMGQHARAKGHLEEALELAREIGSDQATGNTLCDLGILALYEHRHRDAVSCFAISLDSAYRAGWRTIIFQSLRGLAAAAAAGGEFEHAGRLLGAADAIQQEIGDEIPLYARAAYEPALAPLIARLAEEGIAAAYAEGQSMSDSEAAAYGLATVEERAPL